MAWGREIAQRTGLFLVPRVLEITDTALVQEHLVDFEQLRNSRFIRTLPVETGRRLADVLAAIHDSPEDRHNMCGQSRHGDFTCENILYNAESDSVAIVDWSDPIWHTQASARIGQHLDLATLVMSVFASNPFGNGVPNAEAIVGSFLSHYRRQRPDSSALRDLRAEFPDVLQRFYDHDWSLLTRARLWSYRGSYRRALEFIQREDF